MEDYQQLLGASCINNEEEASSYFQHGNYVDAEDALQRLYITERKEFSSLLEEQISDAAIFYEATLVPSVRELIAGGEFEEAAGQLLQVVAFVTVNIITFRQLLIRYDVSALHHVIDAHCSVIIILLSFLIDSNNCNLLHHYFRGSTVVSTGCH